MFGKFGKVLTNFYNKRHVVRFQKGTAKTASGKNISSLEEGLNEMSKCGNCGCNECNGVRSWLNPQTGQLLGMYIKGPECGPFEIVIECLADAHRNATKLVQCQGSKIEVEEEEAISE